MKKDNKRSIPKDKGVEMNKFEEIHKFEPVCPICRNGLLRIKTDLCWECENCKQRYGRKYVKDPRGTLFFPYYRAHPSLSDFKEDDFLSEPERYL